MKATAYTILSLLLTLHPATAKDITPEEAIGRLESYGLIRPATTEPNNGMDLVWHMRKLKNGDEEINDYPWLLEILTRDEADNHIPVSCLKAFVKAGATLKGDGEYSVLSMAAHTANWKAMRFLIEAGADINEKYDGRLLTDIKNGAENETCSLSKDAESIIMLLMDKGYKATSTELEELALLPDTHNVIQRLIDAEVPVTDNVGYNALKGFNAKGVKRLIELGHIVPPKDEELSEKETELHDSTIASCINIHLTSSTGLSYKKEQQLLEMLELPVIRNHTDGNSIREVLTNASSNHDDLLNRINEMFRLEDQAQTEEDDLEEVEAEYSDTEEDDE